MENISEHISYLEATHSDTALRLGIQNIPDERLIASMKLVAEKCFEPIRKEFGALRVSSFYRCEKLNAAVKGQPSSQHLRGEAIDIDGGRDLNLKILAWAKENLEYDQLLNEFPDDQGRPAWVHISYSPTAKQRKQFLIIK